MSPFFFFLFFFPMLVSIVLVLLHPIRRLAIIQAILTISVVVMFVVAIGVAMWMHRMPVSARQEWQPWVGTIIAIFWYGTLISWLLFTIFHFISWVRLKPQSGMSK